MGARHFSSSQAKPGSRMEELRLAFVGQFGEAQRELCCNVFLAVILRKGRRLCNQSEPCLASLDGSCKGPTTKHTLYQILQKEQFLVGLSGSLYDCHAPSCLQRLCVFPFPVLLKLHQITKLLFEEVWYAGFIETLCSCAFIPGGMPMFRLDGF